MQFFQCIHCVFDKCFRKMITDALVQTINTFSVLQNITNYFMFDSHLYFGKCSKCLQGRYAVGFRNLVLLN